MTTLGAQLAHVVTGEVHIAMSNAAYLSQQQGFVHAGAIGAILDSACGHAALTVAPAGADVVTAEYKINLMRPAIGDRFLAVGRVQNAGRTLTVCSGEVRAFPPGFRCLQGRGPHAIDRGERVPRSVIGRARGPVRIAAPRQFTAA